MRLFPLFCLLLLLGMTAAATLHAAPQMRPYTGIGLLLLSESAAGGDDVPLYGHPGLDRTGSLKPGGLPSYGRMLAPGTGETVLIVTGRKGDWYRVEYDDAGREAWLNPGRSGAFRPWDDFLRGRVCAPLPGTARKYARLSPSPGAPPLDPGAVVAFAKILRVEQDWAMVLSDRNMLGWMRWRDEDGRLLTAVIDSPREMQP